MVTPGSLTLVRYKVGTHGPTTAATARRPTLPGIPTRMSISFDTTPGPLLGWK